MSIKIPGSQSYFDTTQLQNLQGEGKTSQALGQASDQFEAMFLQMMLKSMRDANQTLEQHSPLTSRDQQLYQGMYDDQLAFEISRKHGLGLSEMLVRQLGGTVQPDADPKGNKDKG
ncbi:rod-binding protein [Dongshaea marina]|uniref:rod-binding protein n=1 Tax=Dongshaea marina TaxID=2047966 RepID=UPI000D3E3933|nr:rod-binding protein [Dongshaea marina]